MPVLGHAWVWISGVSVMALHAQLFSTAKDRPAPRIAPDLRRHRRVQLTLSGRFMRADRNEYPCELKDISVGGASVSCATGVTIGERIVAYFDQLGGLEGLVTRTFVHGFAMQFKVTAHKKEKLAAQLTWLINRDAFPDDAGRKHERVGIAGRKTKLKLDDGIVIEVDVLDISASGTSLGTSARPPIGSEVLVGKIKAFVRRHHDKGIGLQFAEMQDINALRQSVF
jgi:hypothetical protein